MMLSFEVGRGMMRRLGGAYLWHYRKKEATTGVVMLSTVAVDKQEGPLVVAWMCY